jgi:glutaminyl-tRNA synthetase
MENLTEKSLNFIEEIIESDRTAGKNGGEVRTRFPPEPNGYLHIGHAKAICVNFGLGVKYAGKTNLRFDDTNPTKEEIEYVDSIREDVKWLGFEWAEERYASDYFDKIYDLTISLIKKGLAYIDSSTAAEIAAMKGTPTQAGTNSPHRDRPVEENLRIFEEMRAGKHEEGTYVLRAKIDMASPNMHLRDPLLYRIKFAHHHQTGDKWCIYPMYDYAHPISDALEGITHSICTLEFEVHRPLYEWIIENLDLFPSRQIEFARLNVEYMITSKRKLLGLVQNKIVTGWDDPRMPTISGMRRRGYTPAAVREFCTRVGVAKRENMSEMSLLDFCLREDLNKVSQRVMVVLEPIKVVITNYPVSENELLLAENNPENEADGTRELPFGREIYIDSDDFMENPPKKYFRLALGQKVRLKHAYIIQCDEVVKDEAGNILELRCTYFENSKSGSDTSGISVKGVIHWVSVAEAMPVEVRLYEQLFTDPTPDRHAERDFMEFLNTNSLQILPNAMAEASLKEASVEKRYQFLRKGYFCMDKDSTTDKLIFNQTIGLKDSWSKEQKK